MYRVTRSGPITGRLGDEPTSSVSRSYASSAVGDIGHEREILNTHHTRICECAFFSCNLLPRSLFVQCVSAVSCVLGKGVNERQTERAVLFFYYYYYRTLRFILNVSCARNVNMSRHKRHRSFFTHTHTF